MTSCKSPVKVVCANSLEVTVTCPMKQHPLINIYNTFYLSQLGLFPLIKKIENKNKNFFNPFVSSYTNDGGIFLISITFQIITYFITLIIYNLYHSIIELSILTAN